MNPEQARALVTETFPKPFDKVRFHQFVRELLNGFNEDKSGAMAVPEAFASHVRSCTRLGTYESPDKESADVLIVNTTEPWKLERTRTALRDFVAHKLKRGDSYKEAGLVAFVSPDPRSWRFSYVRMEYETKRNAKTGKIAVEERLTPARRFSYIVGEGESCHTAQTRFLDLLQDTENNPALAQIEDAFSVEAVTKEFFNKYAELFGDIHAALEKLVAKDKAIGNEFKKKNISTVDFGKKLMGQIVFLYFLQKKGWLGVGKGQDWGTGPHDFLRRLARGDYGAYDNFFNDVLEPLFYDTLATDRGHEAWCNRFKCRIPFLNGGLFEPLGNYDWRKTDITLPNNLFTNSEYVDEGVTGTGVLDVFDRYNFTVNEAEPLEKEVAIDPEMLGKVFENLIEENRRKGLGAFYTPREIVHYKCQESLINYLDTALNKNKEIVPRNDIETFIHLGEQISHYEAVDAKYRIKMPPSIEKHARLIDEKLAAITVCDPAVGSGAYPVGMMTEIVRARSALTPYFNDVHERTPYHFKRHAIQNCLYGVDIDAGAVEIAKLRLWLSLVVDEEDMKQIKPLPNLDYKIVVGNSLLGVEKTLFNEKLFQQLEKLKPLYFDASDTAKKASLRWQIDGLIHQLTNGKETFDFEIYFSEIFHCKGGFDVVIANPPYGADIESILSVLRPLYHDAIRNYADIYKMFMQMGLRKLRIQGIQVLITPNTFLAQPRYMDIRKVLLEYDIVKIVNLGEEVFENVVVPTCLSFVKRAPPSRAFHFADLTKDSKFTGDLRGIPFCQVPLQQVRSSKDLSLYSGRALRENEVLFVDALEIKDAGIQYHRSGIGLKNKGGNDLYERVFSSERKAFKSTVPTWYGRRINRWFIEPKTDEFFNLDYRRVLKSNESVSFSENTFEVSPKILWRQTASCLLAAIDTEKRWFRNTIQCAFIKETYKGKLDIHFVLGVINSRYIKHVYNSLVKEAGRVFPQIKLTHVKKLPLVIADKSKQQEIADMVKQILAAKKRDAEADTTEWEHEIDRLVYALYGLTKDEIKIIEENCKG